MSLPRITRTAFLYSSATVALICVTLLATVAAPLPISGAKTVAGKLHYNRDVRPILVENCFLCHGPDSASRKAGLRLDKFKDAVQKRENGTAIVPFDPLASQAIQRILGNESAGALMPPVESHKQLTEAQKTILVRWIAEGAEYEPLWSYIAPKRLALPVVKNTKWVRNTLDRFILARLEKEGLTPAPEADRRTLARRLSLDLTGLPPTPEDVQAFVADTSATAYENLVDKYLAMPQWGEHRARYWLDAARYADTHGIHFDNFREMWSYRDWVISAYNQNMPYDQFTIEQLAGDLLPKPTLNQRIASGFNRCNITTNEGGAIDDEYYVLYARDRTETFGQVFLGTTTGCAVCHDHKFDPISQREFYSLSAYFNNFTQKAMDGNVQNTPPIVAVPMEGDRVRFDALQPERDAARKSLEARKVAAKPDFDKWLAGAKPDKFQNAIPVTGLAFQAKLDEGMGNEATAMVNGQSLKTATTTEAAWTEGAIFAKAYQKKANATLVFPAAGDFEKDAPYSAALWVKLPAGESNGAIIARMDDAADYRGWDIWLEGNRVASHLIHKWPEDALKNTTREGLSVNQWHHICVTYDGTAKKAGLQIYVDGIRRDVDSHAEMLKGSTHSTVPFKVGQRNAGQGAMNIAIQDVRLYNRALSDEEIRHLSTDSRLAYLVTKGVRASEGEKSELFENWLRGEDVSYRDLSAKLAALDSEDGMIRARGTVAHVAQEKDESAMAFLLFRGDYDKRREKVLPATPAAMPAMPSSYPRNRLGLAKWLLRPEHPLTARVAVNRMWQEIFGQGLVRTTGDFGVTGELPSHPELLDWLAVEFREKGWNMKRFYKMLVLSATYRQSAVTTPYKKRVDPQNRLLAHGARFRMDAEMVRDYALASSGLLVKQIGGASVRPYQPDGVWEAVAMIGSNTRDYRRDSGASLYRRSLYTFIKRAAPPASMDIFNAPSREVCTMRRERTDTPLQALVTMNDVQFVEAARRLAERALYKGGQTTAQKLDFIANRLLARPLRMPERIVVETTLADLESHYKLNPAAARDLIAVGESKTEVNLPEDKLAAWTVLVNQLMNLDEVLNK